MRGLDDGASSPGTDTRPRYAATAPAATSARNTAAAAATRSHDQPAGTAIRAALLTGAGLVMAARARSSARARTTSGKGRTLLLYSSKARISGSTPEPP